MKSRATKNQNTKQAIAAAQEETRVSLLIPMRGNPAVDRPKITPSRSKEIERYCQRIVDQALSLPRLMRYLFSDDGCGGGDDLGDICTKINPHYSELIELQFQTRDKDRYVNARLAEIEEILKFYIGVAVKAALWKLLAPTAPGSSGPSSCNMAATH